MSEAARADGTLDLHDAAWQALLHDLPRAPGVELAMALIDGVRRSQIGAGLLTVNLVALGREQASHEGEPPLFELERLWSSDPVAYPVCGRKRKTLTPWTRQLLCEGQPFVGEGDVALAQVFDDHALIASLGLHAVVNVPLLDEKARCFATFNLLGTRARWRTQDLALARLLALLATPAVAQAARETST